MLNAFDNNRSKLRKLAEEEGFTSLILLGEPNLIYTLGFRNPAGALVLTQGCGDYLLVPLLEYTRIASISPREIEVKTYFRGGEEGIKADIPKRDIAGETLTSAITNVLGDCGKKTGLDYSWIRADLAREIELKTGAIDATNLIKRARIVKEPWEVELIEKASSTIQEALRRIIHSIQEGVSEHELAGLLEYEVKRLGAWGVAFETIVAFYSNTAYPHHPPSEVRLTIPGPVLVDAGAVYNGYRSDMTRSFWWGKSSGRNEYREVVESIVEAQETAIDNIAPGVEAWQVDSSARKILETRNLSRYFIHGLGHGVGVEIHEEPYLRPGSKTILEKGMVLTVEPGVYIGGVYGARVEDLVLVTEKGRRILTRFAKILEL